MTTLREAAEARANASIRMSSRPSQRRSAESENAPRHARISLDKTKVVRAPAATGAIDGTHVVGMASVTERGYEMWDVYGPYKETVGLDAFDNTLAAGATVEFTLNHNRGGGAPMASTRNGTLILAAVKESDPTGLAYDAEVDPTRNDVADMIKALDRGDLAEASFKFGIVRGQWSPDYMEFRIEEVNMDGGDVTAANFGANPLATSGLRSAQTSASSKPGRSLVVDDDLAAPSQSLI